MTSTASSSTAGTAWRGWRAAGSTSASGPRPRPAAREALGASWSGGIARFVALNTLGWLRARRGEDDVWSLLDEALAIARTTAHLQRLWPVAVARAEAGALDGGLEPHLPLLVEVLELARRCRHGMAIGEIGYWLGSGRWRRRRRRATGPPSPFAHSLAGDHLGAAAALPPHGMSVRGRSRAGRHRRRRLAAGGPGHLPKAGGGTGGATAVASQLRALGARVPARRASKAAAPEPQHGRGT